MKVDAPVDCEVIAVNDLLKEDPELVNNGAEDDGWLVRIKIKGGTSALMDIMDFPMEPTQKAENTETVVQS